MYIVAHSLLADADESRDVVNDIFADVLTGRTMVPAGCSDGWWVVMTRNRCLNIINRMTTRQRVERQVAADVTVTGGESDIAELIDSKGDRLDRVYEYIDTQLPPQTRRIILMHYSEKRTYSQIAAMLDISETAVYKHLAKGIKQLKEKFKNK